MLLFLLSVGVALGVSALCSIMEATLLSLTPSHVADIARRYPKTGAIWQRFKENIDRPIGVILLLNTAAHTIGASIAGAQFGAMYGDRWLMTFSLVFTFLMLQYTEILPKTMGVRYNREVALIIARPLSLMVRVLTPVLHVIHWLNRPFEGRKRRRESMATVDEITALAGLARISNQISSHQERIIHGASRLSELPVEEVMIPVEQVSFLTASQEISEAIVAAHVEAHTRYPVCEEGDHDRVAGYVNFKEMIYFMRTNPGEPTLRGIIRPVRFVSPEKTAADLLKAFASEHVHMAIVRDAEGKTLGMITAEDIVEELVGDLEDEFDRLPRMVHSLPGGTWMIGGGTPMNQVRQSIGQELPEAKSTFSAWLLDKFDHPPRPGESYREGPFNFVVRRVRRGKLFEVAVYRSEGS